MPCDIELENKEEETLLNILKKPDFNHKVSAFVRLVRIYKKKDENVIVYKFLESFEYTNNEKTNILLDALYKFIISDESSQKSINIWESRILEIYKNEKIMENLIKICNLEGTQTNLFVLFHAIATKCPLKVEWLTKIVKVFYNTNRPIIERLSAKVIITSLENGVELELNELLMVQSKAVRTTNKTDDNDHLMKLLKRLENTQTSFHFYLSHLKQQNIEKIAFFANLSFLNTIKQELNERHSEVVQLLIAAIEAVELRRSLVLQHFIDLIDICPELGVFTLKVIKIEKLIELVEGDDEEVSYLSTLLINKIVRPDES